MNEYGNALTFTTEQEVPADLAATMMEMLKANYAETCRTITDPMPEWSDEFVVIGPTDQAYEWKECPLPAPHDFHFTCDEGSIRGDAIPGLVVHRWGWHAVSSWMTDATRR